MDKPEIQQQLTEIKKQIANWKGWAVNLALDLETGQVQDLSA